jgi:hypothetical protein
MDDGIQFGITTEDGFVITTEDGIGIRTEGVGVVIPVTVDTGITYKFSMGQLPGFAVNPLPLFWVDARQETRI